MDADVSLSGLIDPDVIHFHRLGEGGIRGGRSRPCAADGDIEDEEKLLVERRGELVASGGIPARLGLIKLAVQIPADLAFLPFEGDDVEVAENCSSPLPPPSPLTSNPHLDASMTGPLNSSDQTSFQSL